MYMCTDSRSLIRRTCGTCEAVFGGKAGMLAHCRAKKHEPLSDLILAAGTGCVASTPAKQIRAIYTYAQKSRAIERYQDLEQDPGCLCPHKTVCAEIKLPHNKRNYLTRWLKATDRVRAQVAAGNGRWSKGHVVLAQFPGEEDELYIRFLGRRIVKGYPCNQFWLKLEFGRVLRESKPDGWDFFKFSNTWASNFCRRYNISNQCAYNSKAKDVVEREELIKQFHVLLQHWQASGPRRCPKYGRFTPRLMFHVDQIPLPFASGCRRTLNPVNSGSCRICAPSTSGLEKRQATLQLWICADITNPQPIRPAIIFRGSRGGRLPKARESALYDSLVNICVHFQKCAWADGDFCMENLLNVNSDLAAAGYMPNEEILAGMDNHAAQRTPAMMQAYADLGMHPLFTPAGCTDCVSPIDHHVGRFIQNFMSRRYDDEIQRNPDAWMAVDESEELEDPHCRSAETRRMLLAQWLSDAWTDLQLNHGHLLRSAFVQTGFLVAMDGSEDRLIKLQGWVKAEPYKFRSI